VDEKAFAATVAERAGLSKEEARDLTRATLEELAGQLSSGELHKLVPMLPDWLRSEMPRHERPAHPVRASEFIHRLARRTGLKEEEVRRGVAAVLTTLREAMDPQHLDHALSLLPKEYRELATAEAAHPRGAET
jgi:uncharacterized protein (DUF2267 family)